jgi:hypothetical protein
MNSNDGSCQDTFERPPPLGGGPLIHVRPGLARPLPNKALPTLIGGVCVSLPLVLTIGNFIFAGTAPPGSLSGYYYTDMRNFFIGGLCALGAFLLAYRGPGRLDALITNGAGMSLIMVALCPTRPPAGGSPLALRQDVVGDLHDLFATTAPLALGVMALRLARARPPEAIIHRACAATIFACVLLAIISGLILRAMNVSSSALLACEVFALLASGASWLTARRMPPSAEFEHAED